MIFDRIMGNLAIRQLIQTNLIVTLNLKLMLKILKFVLNEDDLNGCFIVTPEHHIGEIISQYDGKVLARFIENDKVVERVEDIILKRSAALIDKQGNQYKVPHSLYRRILKGELKHFDYLIYNEDEEVLNKFYVSINIDTYLNNESKHDFILSLEEAINAESKDIFKHIKFEIICYEGSPLYKM